MLPSVLTIHLIRYDNLNRKITVPFEFPFTFSFEDIENLDLSFCTNRDSNYLSYILIGSIVHIGNNLHSGHYYSYIYSDEKWWCFNDNYVTNVSIERVKEDTKNNGYMLFYLKKSEIETNSN